MDGLIAHPLPQGLEVSARARTSLNCAVARQAHIAHPLNPVSVPGPLRLTRSSATPSPPSLAPSGALLLRHHVGEILSAEMLLYCSLLCFRQAQGL